MIFLYQELEDNWLNIITSHKIKVDHFVHTNKASNIVECDLVGIVELLAFLT